MTPFTRLKYSCTPQKQPAAKIAVSVLRTVFHKYLDQIWVHISKKKKNAIDNLHFARVRNLRLEEEAALSDHEILALWNELIVFHERFHGRNDHLCALVYANLGLLFAGEKRTVLSLFSGGCTGNWNGAM
jgi:hypothetical protein